jgi:hypothetical protein
MVGTVALVVLFTLSALGVVLYGAFCEAEEDLPCKHAKRRGKPSEGGIERPSRQGSKV